MSEEKSFWKHWENVGKKVVHSKAFCNLPRIIAEENRICELFASVKCYQKTK